MEFIELCKQKTRMCKKYNYCGDCPIELHCEKDNRISLKDPAELETLILEWAAANPEEAERQQEIEKMVTNIIAAGQLFYYEEQYIRAEDAIRIIKEGIIGTDMY